MPSFYQSAFTDTASRKVDGSTWCSTMYQELNVDGTPVVVEALFGFNSKTKCTYQFASAAGTHAPGFMLKKADSVDYFINIIEWYNQSHLETAAVLATTDTASFIGGYDAALGVALNPKLSGGPTDATWDVTVPAWLYSSKTSPNVRPAGSIGDAIFYTKTAGISSETMTLTVDSTVLINSAMRYKNEVNAFNTKLATYNTERTSYDDKVTAEETRRADFFAASLSAEIILPMRPMKPMQPREYMEPVLKLS